MQHDDWVYLGHMLDTARKAVDKLGAKTRADLDADEDLRIVLTHWVQIIGEAASRVSAATQSAHPEIPWRRIVAMRHRIVHDYMNIDVEILWEVVSRSLLQLIRLLEPIAPPEGA
jgi:uncharacterized protein with HEPN domain